MKRTTIVVIVAALLLTASASFAAGKPQTTCPVTGKPIDAKTSPHVDYQGQRIYFCCGACPAKFQADPESFFAKLEKDGVELENIQTTCPVSGEKLGGMGEAVSHAYKGRTVKFCCGACVKEFDKDPAAYLAKLPGT